LIGRNHVNLIVSWCGRFLFFVVPHQFSPDVGKWPENQILIPHWTYFHCPGTILVAGVGPILFRSCSAHCPTGHKPELSDQNGPHSPPPGAWLLPPLSAWGTVPLDLALLTVPLDTSQSSLTKWASSSSWSLAAAPSVCLGHSTTWSCSAYCPT